MTVVKSPRRMPSAASPMLWVPVEQAVTMHMFGPRAPSSMAIWPDAVSGSMLAMKNGLTDRGRGLHRLDGVRHEPRSAHARAEVDPHVVAFGRRSPSPASATACLAAATPNTTFLSVRRTALKSIHAVSVEVVDLAGRPAVDPSPGPSR